LRYFRHSLHVARVNYGLYAELQLDIILQIIKSHSALRDWVAVDRHYSLMGHLYRRIYDSGDRRLEEGLQDIASWYRFAENAK